MTRRALDYCPQLIGTLIDGLSVEEINRPEEDGRTLLAYAVKITPHILYWGEDVFVQTVETLFQAGARVDVKGSKGQTALEELATLKRLRKGAWITRNTSAR